MRGRKIVALLAPVLLAVVPVLAGGSHAKCAYSTQECLDHMAKTMKTSGWVGLELEVDEETGVPTVQKVVPGSPADTAGLRAGDVLFALNGVEINSENHEALKAAKKDWKPGQSVTYTIKRDGRDRQVEITLAPMPADVLAAWIGNHMLEHANMEMAAQTR